MDVTRLKKLNYRRYYTQAQEFKSQRDLQKFYNNYRGNNYKTMKDYEYKFRS